MGTAKWKDWNNVSITRYPTQDSNKVPNKLILSFPGFLPLTCPPDMQKSIQIPGT
jgi:hypothetical protein